MIVRPFRLADLEAYRDRVVETRARDWFGAEGVEHLEDDPHARTVEIDGVPICSGGLTDQGDGLANAWALVAEIPRSCLVGVHHAYRKGLVESGFRRIETHVEASFLVSHRWVRLMGFVMDHDRPTEARHGLLFVRYIFAGTRK